MVALISCGLRPNVTLTKSKIAIEYLNTDLESQTKFHTREKQNCYRVFRYLLGSETKMHT